MTPGASTELSKSTTKIKIKIKQAIPAALI
jgi:hypothetical protein